MITTNDILDMADMLYKLVEVDKSIAQLEAVSQLGGFVSIDTGVTVHVAGSPSDGGRKVGLLPLSADTTDGFPNVLLEPMLLTYIECLRRIKRGIIDALKSQGVALGVYSDALSRLPVSEEAVLPWLLANIDDYKRGVEMTPLTDDDLLNEEGSE